VLDGFNPPHGGFKALKAKLAELRSAAPRAEAPDDRLPTAPHRTRRQGRTRPRLAQKLGVKSQGRRSRL